VRRAGDRFCGDGTAFGRFGGCRTRDGRLGTAMPSAGSEWPPPHRTNYGLSGGATRIIGLFCLCRHLGIPPELFARQEPGTRRFRGICVRSPVRRARHRALALCSAGRRRVVSRGSGRLSRGAETCLGKLTTLRCLRYGRRAVERHENLTKRIR